MSEFLLYSGVSAPCNGEASGTLWLPAASMWCSEKLCCCCSMFLSAWALITDRNITLREVKCLCREDHGCTANRTLFPFVSALILTRAHMVMSKVVHCVGNRVPFRTHPMLVLGIVKCLPLCRRQIWTTLTFWAAFWQGSDLSLSHGRPRGHGHTALLHVQRWVQLKVFKLGLCFSKQQVVVDERGACLVVCDCLRITVIVFMSYFKRIQRPFVFVLSVSVIPDDLSMTLLGDLGVYLSYW